MAEDVLRTEYYFPAGVAGVVAPGRYWLIEKALYAPLKVLAIPGVKRPLAGCVPLQLLQADWDLDLSHAERKMLKVTASGPLLWFGLLSLHPHSLPTVDLLRPLVLNPRTRRGLRLIRQGPVEMQQHRLGSWEGLWHRPQWARAATQGSYVA